MTVIQATESLSPKSFPAVVAGPPGKRTRVIWLFRRVLNAGAGLLAVAAMLHTQPLRGERRGEPSRFETASIDAPRSFINTDDSQDPEPPAPSTMEKPRETRSIEALKAAEELNVPPPPSPSPTPIPGSNGSKAKRIRVRTELGRTVVAKVQGTSEGQLHILLPDGQMGIADVPAYTDQPFVPTPVDTIINDLKSSPFRDFETIKTPHYVIVYQGSKAFAESSAKVLEDLYKGLMGAFRKREIPVHDSEFPLLAVIFKTEEEFRAFRPVAKEIQAYYEIYSNRIFFYESSQRDEDAPEIAALRRPQTVAHEGTHQILQNIGIQPRLAAWPPWLIEGLAEYCSTPQTTKKGTTWAGLGVVNSLHLATIKDLNDPLSAQVSGSARPEHIGRPKGMPLVEYLVKKTELTPTDYALSWAVTHYLAVKKVDLFLKYLKKMSAMPPLGVQTPDDHLASFRAAFGSDLSKLDREIDSYLGKLKVPHRLPYYAVVFQQRIGTTNLHKRAAIVSQSPTMIRQWLETITNPNSEEPSWEVHPFPTRAGALAVAEEWIQPQP